MYLISYDVSNDRIRGKIAKELENYGKRVQFSVFECRISKTQMAKLYQKMASLLSVEEEGNIRIYSICANCEEKLQLIGVDLDYLTTEENDLFIV